MTQATLFAQGLRGCQHIGVWKHMSVLFYLCFSQIPTESSFEVFLPRKPLCSLHMHINVPYMLDFPRVPCINLAFKTTGLDLKQRCGSAPQVLTSLLGHQWQTFRCLGSEPPCLFLILWLTILIHCQNCGFWHGVLSVSVSIIPDPSFRDRILLK